MPLTPTTRLSLVQIDDNPTTGDFVDVDPINNNFAALDAVIGATPATSGARPSSPFNGQLIRESDTRRVMVRNSSQTVWDPVSGAFTCTSSTRPAQVYDGMLIRETDTRRFLVYNGTQTTWDAVTIMPTGSSGSRPGSPTDGMLYRETDTRRLAIYNGTAAAWETVNGAFACTSGARPSVVFDGMLIRETDTRRMYVWNATQSTWELIYNGIIGPPVGTVFARRTTDLTRSATTTLTDDTQITLPVVSGAVYAVDSHLSYVAPSAGLFKLKWTAPGSSSFEWTVNGPGQSVTTWEGLVKYERRDLSLDAVVGGANPTALIARPSGLFIAGGNGSFTLQWAQNAASGSNTLFAGSWVRLVRMA